MRKGDREKEGWSESAKPKLGYLDSIGKGVRERRRNTQCQAFTQLAIVAVPQSIVSPRLYTSN
jgi:hypothetical protein